MSEVIRGLPSEGPVQVERLAEGGLWRLRLATPKANILDQAKFEILGAVFERAAADSDLKAILLTAEGPHFSFGASVEEHMPGLFETMIRTFHAVIRSAVASNVVCLAAVRGQCLGGGLELVSVCSRIFAASDAMFGQPEIRLGVFAPVASVLLPDRIGQARAEELCLSGRSLAADEALRLGLIDEVGVDPEASALSYYQEYLAPHSAKALRLATEAARIGLARRFESELQAAENLYLERLMTTEDAAEGLQAFLDKRQPQWRNR
jgi:cyclohexa-1,5-dienecarbonyl-CoA hydratase